MIIATGGTMGAVKAATASIPIVFFSGVDPVALGYVASLNRPGANATGIAMLNTELLPKRVQLLHEALPGVTAIASLDDPASPVFEVGARSIGSTAKALGLDFHLLTASAERDFETVFTEFVQLRLGGMVISSSPLFNSQVERLAALAFRHRVPAIQSYRAFAAAGGLLSYGGPFAESYRLVGNYAARILKGEKAADLPVQQVTRVELVINLKTAKAFGLTVPLTLFARADEVIE